MKVMKEAVKQGYYKNLSIHEKINDKYYWVRGDGNWYFKMSDKVSNEILKAYNNLPKYDKVK
jgi:hypothetical protein